MDFLGFTFDMNDAFIVAAVMAAFMGVFDHLWELLLDIWDWLLPFEVIMDYEQAVVVRWGVYNRTVGPGFRWKIPFGVEDIMEDTVVRRAEWGDVQSCESKDGKPVNISPVIVYRVGNIKRWILEVDDAADALLDVAAGIVEDTVDQTNWDDIKGEEFKEAVYEAVREEGLLWGARVDDVKFADRSKTKALRLWTNGGDVYEADE